MRSSIGGIYAWRIGPYCPPEYRPKTEAEVRRFYPDFTLRQAFAFCPSPEALFRYVQLLVQPPAPIAPRIERRCCWPVPRRSLTLTTGGSSISSTIWKRTSASWAVSARCKVGSPGSRQSG